MSDVRIVRAEDERDPERIAALAREIWRKHYVPIVGEVQVEYMLERFESADAIRDAIARGDEYWLALGGETLVGYLALRTDEDPRFLKLNKLYLCEPARGSGWGRRLLSFAEARARDRGAEVLWLLVNKQNPAVHFYERVGFSRAAECVTDIGHGFVMDDFRMEKRVREPAA